MEPEAAKMIGAGIAAIAAGGAGIGIGNMFASYMAGAMRNPSAARSQLFVLFLGFALVETTGLFGLFVSMLLLFVV